MPRKGLNIYKRKDRRWEGRYIKYYEENKKAKYGYVYGKTYNEVKKELLNKQRNSGEQTIMSQEENILYKEVVLSKLS